MILAPYASSPEKSKGRVYDEAPSNLRNVFQRDRDRIIHSSSFRRLQYKTQVFVNHEGDMFRSRLTHSLEVAQVSRGIARSLNCHEDLVEAIALAHDLGHTPFGHAGQDALNDCMREFGGFEHNLQSLRVVDKLEKKYALFDGLNLSYEVREGILKHCSLKNARKLGELGQRFLNKTQPTLEAQIVNIADEIAYLHHDLDDGFRSGILDFDLLKSLHFFQDKYDQVINEHGSLNHEQILNEIIRRMMNMIIRDVCNESFKKIETYNPTTVEDVRASSSIVNFSESMLSHIKQIKQFSRVNLYNHPRISNMTDRAHITLKKLFKYFQINYDLIPNSFKTDVKETKERIISDYIAGMTDRFAEQFSENIKN